MNKLLLQSVIILVFLQFFFVGKCSSQNMDCSPFKSGSFKIQDAEDGLVLIQRSDSIQIEESVKYGLILKQKIRWLTVCSFSLEIIEVLKDSSGFEYPTDMITTVKITEIGKDFCMQEVTSNKYNIIIRNKLERISQ